MKQMTQNQIDTQKAYFKEQIASTTSHYTDLVIKTYYYILQCCRKENRNWCYGKEVSDWQVAKFAYQFTYNGRVDQMGSDIIKRIKQLLCSMGYIAFRKENEEWKIYVIKDLDFLPSSIDEYITIKNQGNDKINIANEIVNYLLNEGIKIFQFNRICWKCRTLIPIYSYYLDVQIRNEMKSNYLLKDSDLNNHLNKPPIDNLEALTQGQQFSEIGIGVIEKIDRYLATKINTVDKRYSKTMDKSYFLNLCNVCDSIQGINYTVVLLLISLFHFEYYNQAY